MVDRIRLSARENLASPVDDIDEPIDQWSGTTNKWLRAPKTWRTDPTQLVEDGEFWDQIRKCFAGLPERQAQVFALRTFDELDAEIPTPQVQDLASALALVIRNLILERNV